MIFLLIAGLSVGIEGGVDQPVLGFEDLGSGSVFRIFAAKNEPCCNISLALESSYHSGENPGYGISMYGLRLSCFKTGWKLAPLFEFGFDYLSRSLKNSSESGVVIDYALGFLIPFKKGSLNMFPKFYYSGTTDYKRHAGFLGMKLGIGYEF